MRATRPSLSIAFRSKSGGCRAGYRCVTNVVIQFLVEPGGIEPPTS